MLLKVGLLALGGALGTLFRYWGSGLAYRWLGDEFPWGTLMVNALGSFFIGLAWAVFERTDISPSWRLFLFIGLFGGFTTFSTLSLETLNLLREGSVRVALLSLLANNVLGLALVYLGFIATKAIMIFR